MNERIKELFEQALEEFNAGPVFAAYIIPDPIKEKFAQLIVQECAQVAEEVNGDSRARKCVLEHFGVEE